ncbi:hypothetical protein BDU57DRAFT_524200 [Ampelomyces quisqualis]|uniref:Uncharacterized protein n=1 Tax=Ampelomyces quisqualis TaxID=50730 RepID=A0A6A5QAS0_AMPQU|nr:hypothetical protein BDU57DRAFT_524200 [Ampelomyces quisqualis]
MQYSINTAAVGELQTRPGFLMVFGYEYPTSPLDDGIDVKIAQALCSSSPMHGLLSNSSWQAS